jgi:hypothetical protein
MSVNLAEAQPHIRDALTRLRDALTANGDVESAVLYGSFVRGGFRAGASDINLALVVRSEDLAKLAAPLRDGWRSARIDPWIARTTELAGLVDAFATRVRDIQRCHHVLAGGDPWSTLSVPRSALRLRLEQELRNHQMRLRHARVLGDAAAQARQLYVSAGALRSDLSLVEELAGGGVHEAIEPLALAIAKRFDLARADVNAVLDYHAHPGGAPGDLMLAAATLLERAVAFVDSMEDT